MAWFVLIRPTSRYVSKATSRSTVGLRLNQAHRGLCQSRDQCNHDSQLCCFIVLFVVLFLLSCSPVHWFGALFPGAILVAVAVGRFANNRSPPTSLWADAATILFDPPGPRLWRGQRWRAIRGRGRECGRDSLELFFELESKGATRCLSCGFISFGLWLTA